MTVSRVDPLAGQLVRVATGDRSAFEELYRRTSAKLFGICLRILPERAEAEEALQEVYVSVWQRSGLFDPQRGSAVAWLSTLARNRAIDRLRSAGRLAHAPIEMAGEVADPAPLASERLEDAGEQAQRGAQLADCMERLDGRDAAFLRCAFLEGSTYAELASRASTPLGTVKSRIRRALAKLRECLS